MWPVAHLLSWQETFCQLIKGEKKCPFHWCCIFSPFYIYSNHPLKYSLIFTLHVTQSGVKWMRTALESFIINHLPFWRVKSFIHSFMRLVIRGACPDWWLIGWWMLCHSTHWHGLDSLHCVCVLGCITGFHILHQYKVLLERFISLFLPQVSALRLGSTMTLFTSDCQFSQSTCLLLPGTDSDCKRMT